LRHVVMMRFKSSATAEQKEAMAAGIRGMTDKIPEILKMTCGPDLGLSDGNHGFVLCARPHSPPPARCQAAAPREHPLRERVHPQHCCIRVEPFLPAGTHFRLHAPLGTLRC
jgi:hypothetical protein